MKSLLIAILIIIAGDVFAQEVSCDNLVESNKEEFDHKKLENAIKGKKFKSRIDLYNYLSEVAGLDNKTSDNYQDWFDETVEHIADKLKLR